MPTDQEKHKKELRARAMRLPLSPGVYLMHDKSGKIIYIGKAKALKNRVSQYFGSEKNHDAKVRRMVASVDTFEYILTDSEFEALVLECSLIKQHSPKYNILLKDDKGYHYIRVSSGPWPRISEAKQIADDGAEYIGPYVSSWSVKQSVDEALKIFRLPSCTRKFPQEIGKGRPCLYYYIKQCCAPCRGKVSEAEYREFVAEALEFLRGGSAKSIRALTEKMNEAAERLEFERAARLRDRIAAIRKMSDRQKVVASRVKEQDVVALTQSAEKSCFEVFRFQNGRLCDRETFLMGETGGAKEARSEFLERYYSMRSRIPPRIALDGPVENAELISQWLTEKAGRKVTVTVPQKGEQARLVEMCRSNAAEQLAQTMGRTGREASALDELARLLGLSEPPAYIESYDISNLAGGENVAGMVVFENGRPLRSAYRKFKIRSVTGQDDYASLREVMTRRVEEYWKNKETGEGFGRLPDLILLDGGKGQVSAVRPVLEEAGLRIPLFGMVKDDRHRTRAIAKDGGEISINSSRSAFTLVSSIQEEVHRFAIGYHRQARKKAAIASSLTMIEGIGPTRARALLKHFKTVAAVRNAAVEELAAAPGMTKPAAQKVYFAFHPEEPVRTALTDEPVHGIIKK
ncbi:excinuclease ABC subunit UvrC [Caproiciproducens sp. NJN-50]|uniref:excinuclease ABC subunit UvrC n=1 Tax=Acutalibacteraceae TaxID=3082771 RepID=UPI000FFDFDD7|nr:MULTISPECIES: excinuclease ABC subunit UvrC [Acutalibacteraceae]QAT50153.1 excinuclease ABC subunit UvrC [Caproiciproducens sp. NJN-50]